MNINTGKKIKKTNIKKIIKPKINNNHKRKSTNKNVNN